MTIGTKIAWTDATMNFWIGCTPVGPGCDDCYAEAWDIRYEAGSHWGKGAPRRRTSVANWRQPYKWDKAAAYSGKPIKVFVSSLSDFFDKEVDPYWRDEAWSIIRDNQNLRWQITTKRIGLAQKMIPEYFEFEEEYRHVGFLATMVNQAEWNRDKAKLIRMKETFNASWIGVSCEPMLGPIDFGDDLARIDWVIFGGESRNFKKPRPFHIDWAVDGIEQCRRAGVAPFMKQTGSHAMIGGAPYPTAHRKGEDPDEWPPLIKVQEFPQALLQ